MTEAEKPLVTFALFAYNQERFIKEAVEGALAQTYSPLEIILSDDCSTDQTFNLMQEITASYDGPHRITLNQNPVNLGLGRHVNRVMELANGELIVAAAGDDISIPERTQIIVDEWSGNPKPSALSSYYIAINENGDVIGYESNWTIESTEFPIGGKHKCVERLVTTDKLALLGCTEAWDKRLFDVFGPLRPDVWNEDNALSLRAWFLDGIKFIPKRLVHYRQHSSNISNYRWDLDRSADGFRRLELNNMVKSERRLALLKGFQIDTEIALQKNLIESELANWLQQEFCKQKTLHTILGSWWSSSILQRIYWYGTCLFTYGDGQFKTWALYRLIPFELFLYLRSSASRFRGWTRTVMSRVVK